MRRPLLFLFISMLLLACGQREAAMESAAAVDMAAPAPEAVKLADGTSDRAAEPAQAEPVAKPQGPLLIYTGNLTVEVDNPVTARDSALAWVQQHGGYSSNESQQQMGNREVLELTVRIPAAQFQPLLRQVERLARRVEDRRVVAQDVTQEFTDNEARLRTKRATEAQYLELLKRAGKISDILEVQNQLTAVREEIEVIEGRQRFFRNQVQYSTLTVNFFRLGEAPVYAEPGFFSKLADSFGSGWDWLLGFVLGLVTLWPLMLLIPLFVWLWRRWGRRWFGAGDSADDAGKAS